MANTPPALVASGAVRPCRFVKPSGDFTGAECDANEDAIGISYQSGRNPPIPQVSTNNHADIGDPIHLYGEGDICLLTYGATVTAGQKLKSDADGQGVPVLTTGTTNQLARAVALEGGASGELRRVQVVRETIRPALA